MTDIQAFIEEIMLFLGEDDVLELKDKAGVRFPLELSWADLTYVACWMGLKRELPGSVHNRMVLGEKTPWTELYLRHFRTKIQMRMNVTDLFELAG